MDKNTPSLSSNKRNNKNSSLKSTSSNFFKTNPKINSNLRQSRSSKNIFKQKTRQTNSSKELINDDKNKNGSHLGSKLGISAFDDKNANNNKQNLHVNLNAYAHLFVNNPGITQPIVDWTMNLRELPAIYEQKHFIENILKKYSNMVPPHFYLEDSENFKKKQMSHSKSTCSYSNSTFAKYRYLTKTLGREPITTDIFTFTTTLRNYNPNKNVFVNQKEWDRNNMISKRPKTSQVKTGTRYEKFLVRPYIIERDKVDVGGQTIYRRKFVINQNEAFDWTGEHMSGLPYNDHYSERNFSRLKDFLGAKGASITGCKFMLGLRDYGGNVRLNSSIKKHRFSEDNKAEDEVDIDGGKGNSKDLKSRISNNGVQDKVKN